MDLLIYSASFNPSMLSVSPISHHELSLISDISQWVEPGPNISPR